MNDDLDLRGLDAERPVPPDLRARLEAALLGAAEGWGRNGEFSVPVEPVPLDAPRPLPAAFRDRMEAVLVAGSRSAGADPGRRPVWLRPLLAVAAVLVLVLGSVAVLQPGRPGVGGEVAAGAPTTVTTPLAPPEAPVSITAPPPAAAPTTATTRLGRATPTQPPAAPGAAPPTTQPPASLLSPTGEDPPAPAPGGVADPPPPGTDPGPAPPYAYPPASDHAGAAPASPGAATAAPPAHRGPAPAGRLRIGVVGGDTAEAAGFSAYVDLLNRAGGVRGRSLETGPPSGDSLVTVNLSSRSLASNPGPGVLLEGLNVTESRLSGPGTADVYSFASPLERQAHLAVDAVYPEAVVAVPGTGPTAVVYRAAEGPYAGVVAEAFGEALGRRGVQVVMQAYDPAEGPGQLTPGDAAFLSLETAAAKAWLADAQATGYGPFGTGRVAGIASLFDPALLPGADGGALPAGARVISPYTVPAGDEGQAIRQTAGSTSAAALHGWATAKSLAVALWQSGAGTPAEVQAALDGLAGYSSGLAPPYETRSGTHSRTPEGALFEVRSGAYHPDDRGFRRDDD